MLVRALLLAALCFSGLSEAADDHGEQALISFLNTLETFSATFTQQRFDEEGALLERSSGECQIKRPGRFLWNYREPFPQTIVSDGTTLSIYDPDLEQVTMSAVGDVPASSPALLLGHETDVARHYVITELSDAGDGDTWFELRPRTSGTDFTAIELAFADGEVRAMRLRDNLGQLTLLNFTLIKRNAAIDDSVFAFQPPAGIDVVRAAQP